MENALESLTLPFLAIMCVVGTIVLVRLDKLSRRKDLEEDELEVKSPSARRRPSRK
jgi:hypothetical protein